MIVSSSVLFRGLHLLARDLSPWRVLAMPCHCLSYLIDWESSWFEIEAETAPIAAQFYG